jgi:hypothetical protein
LIFFLLMSYKRAVVENTGEITLRTEVVGNRVIVRGWAKQYILFFVLKDGKVEQSHIDERMGEITLIMEVVGNGA